MKIKPWLMLLALPLALNLAACGDDDDDDDDDQSQKLCADMVDRLESCDLVDRFIDGLGDPSVTNAGELEANCQEDWESEDACMANCLLAATSCDQFETLVFESTTCEQQCGVSTDDDDDMSGGPFDLIITGDQFNPHNGEVFGIAVVEKNTGTVVATREISFEDGTFNETFEGALEDGKAYYVDYFGDHSLNGSCDEPLADHTWRVDIGVISNHYQLGVVHNTNFTPEACDSF